MSVTVILKFPSDYPESVVKAVENGPTQLAEGAQMRGCFSHRFVAGVSEFLVIDTWRNEGAFWGFFHANEETIKEMFAEAIKGDPIIDIYRNLETSDQIETAPEPPGDPTQR